MNKNLSIAVSAPPHHGSTSTAILLKVLLSEVMPGVNIEVTDENEKGNTREEIERSMEQFRAHGKGARAAEDLADFFKREGVTIKISAKQAGKPARPEEVEAPALKEFREF